MKDLANCDKSTKLTHMVCPHDRTPLTSVFPLYHCQTEDILTVSERLDALGDIAHTTRIIGMVESASSVLNVPELCQATPHRLDMLIFGGDE